MSQENVESVRWESLKARRVQGIGGVAGKALALSLIGGAGLAASLEAVEVRE